MSPCRYIFPLYKYSEQFNLITLYLFLHSWSSKTIQHFAPCTEEYKVFLKLDRQPTDSSNEINFNRNFLYFNLLNISH
jgi:hypothetical protein